ncbi:unnamed protein product [Closterium sp. NIES-54]
MTGSLEAKASRLEAEASLCCFCCFSLFTSIPCRRDLERAKDDGEWAALEATRSLTRESDIGELKTPAKRTPLDLEEELKRMQQKIDINNYEFKPVPKLKEEE